MRRRVERATNKVEASGLPVMLVKVKPYCASRPMDGMWYTKLGGWHLELNAAPRRTCALMRVVTNHGHGTLGSGTAGFVFDGKNWLFDLGSSNVDPHDEGSYFRFDLIERLNEVVADYAKDLYRDS